MPLNVSLSVAALVVGAACCASLAAAPASSITDLSHPLELLAPVAGTTPDSLRVDRDRRDRLGLRHLRLQQRRYGLDVVNGALLAHFDRLGRLYRVDGPTGLADVDPHPALGAALALSAAHSLPEYAGLASGPARLVYVVSSRDGALHLAWEALFSGEREGEPVADRVYVDAHQGTLADVHPQIQHLRNRQTYNLNHSTTLPGTLQRSEGQAPVADVDVNAAHDNAGIAYDCWQALYGRDSYDDAGAKLQSSVHYSSNYNNAFWNGSQMVYGDGNYTDFAPLDRSPDVVNHEFMHAITERESGLIYSYESGAISESISDLAASICDAWVRGAATSDTWNIAEDVYTPGTAGDALRYLAHPTYDGMSTDYYPERYTGSSDNGGVHLNSTIPSLAFYLLANGGHHPRNKTAVVVAGIGIDRAAQIWWRAATTYLTATSNMSSLRSAAVEAANDLYGDEATVFSVHDAFAAVGIGAVTPRPVSLQRGVALGSLQNSTAAGYYYYLDVPAGVRNLWFRTSGGGDADLFVRRGLLPTTTAYTAASMDDTSTESVSLRLPVAGRWYVLLRGTYADVSLLGNYELLPRLQNGVEVGGLQATAPTVRYWRVVVPATAGHLHVQLRPGAATSGNANLFLRLGEAPTPTVYDARSIRVGNTDDIDITAQSGTWYVMVKASTDYADVRLQASWGP